ncbi:Na+/H+ antiporter NhaA [Microbacterium sp. 13-71-7]|jgi:NhaA family Na+:H+ antiporter|uniref:Na+/H+ antiporter NhaA n=1 Tax=Microbacterium sp. 13-71-7 TaxID=1970399 RepID=UPI000BC4E6CE|nr:Na+/H+ antiporter NhaA [Microbacterium sp. 13-71-7]OZB85596.1 MAG: sodium:proton antiporter [Microbacterium sp. 13-71-7]
MSRTSRLLRSPQFPAILLLATAGLGLLLANLPTHDAISGLLGAHFGIPGTALDLSVSHWVSDGVLAIFFFVVALELQYELTRGELNSVRVAIQPAIAAAGGILVPIALYLWIAGSDPSATGWPIPTATDIAFALGVLAVFGRGLPSAVRAFLLALAILDDIVGIVFIAVLFAHGLNLLLLGLGVLAVIVFAVLSRQLRGRATPVVAVLMVIVGLVAWGLFAASGVHATIAGVMLGLVMAPRAADPTRHALEPWVNGLVLPLFAFVAAFVVIPQVPLDELSPAFFAILVALPVGKLIGIGVFGALAQLIRPRGAPPAIRFPDVLAAGALGGIGFTVSLLLANLAFADDAAVRDQAILAVLLGSVIALIVAAALVSWRAKVHRALGDAEDEEPADESTEEEAYGDER